MHEWSYPYKLFVISICLFILPVRLIGYISSMCTLTRHKKCHLTWIGLLQESLTLLIIYNSRSIYGTDLLLPLFHLSISPIHLWH